MPHELDDIGGARELAFHRINVAKDDLDAAKLSSLKGVYSCLNLKPKN